MLFEQGLDPQLVAGIGDGPQEADRHRFDPLRDQPLRHLHHLRFVEIAHHRAAGIDPFGDLESEGSLDEGLGVRYAVIEERQAESSRLPQYQDVAMALGP